MQLSPANENTSAVWKQYGLKAEKSDILVKKKIRLLYTSTISLTLYAVKPTDFRRFRIVAGIRMSHPAISRAAWKGKKYHNADFQPNDE